MFTRQECKELILEKFKKAQIVTRKELINEGRKRVGNNPKHFASVDSIVNKTIKTLIDNNRIVRIEKGQYKKFM